MANKKFYITTPIYYVNDEPHIGHAYTTIVADVLSRYHRWQGDAVFFLTGTDEHGAKVAEMAVKNNMTPKEFCDQNSARFRAAWQILNITNDYFIRTTDPLHERAVVNIFQQLYDGGYLEEREYQGNYCVGCEKFLNDRDLINGQCPDHKRVPEVIIEKNWFFKLEQFLPKIGELIKDDQIKIRPESRKNEVLGLIKDGVLTDFSVSRQKSKVAWGVELPFDQNQVSYVWVDALSNYITAIGYPFQMDDFKKWWPCEVHLMAQDILKFHAVYWPVILLALGLDVPQSEFIHGFFTINGEKMSKTIGNVIKPQELVDRFGADAARYLLLSQFPFGQEADIRENLFAERYNSDLANGLGNAVARITNLIEKNKINIDWQVKIVTGEQQLIFSESCQQWEEERRMEFAQYRFDLVLAAINQRLKNNIDTFLSDKKPWQMAMGPELVEVLSITACELKLITTWLQPFMPQVTQQILDLLTAKQIVKAPILFPRLELNN